jgi:Carboxyl transferase domain
MLQMHSSRQMASCLSRRLLTSSVSRPLSISAASVLHNHMSSVLSKETTAFPTETSLSTVRSFSSSAAAIVDDNAFQRDPSVLKLKFKERLEEERQRAMVGGGLKRIEKQHVKGSLSARERIELLFDDGTFHELDQLKAHRCHEFGMEQKKYPGDGIVTGYGKVNGRFVYAFSQGACVCI